MYRKVILKNISWRFINEAFSALLAFVFYIVLTRYLGERGLGLYSYIFSFFGITILFIDLGFSTHYLRKWSTNTEKFRDDISAIISSKIINIFLISIFLIFYVIIVDNSFGLEFFLA